MTKQEAIQQQIDEIMDTFDFGKVHKMMKAINWRWSSCEAVPEEYEIRKRARELLREAAKSGFVSTGGLTATKTEDEEDGVPWVRMELDFGVTSAPDGVSYER